MSYNFSKEELSLGAVIPINKPLTWTSFNVVKKVNFALKKANIVTKIGHAGTLDPLATGLLILCTGKKTKTIESIQIQPKTYIATIYLGAIRPSYDKETEITETFDIQHINIALIQSTLNQFVGEIQQTPPMYSAVKVQGKPAYLSARQGKDLNLKPKTISIYQIDILDFSSPLLTLKIHCSKGTYIRSLAHDIGRALGIGAYLDDLVRTQIGAYTLDDSFEISSLIQYLENLDLNNSL